MAFICDFYDDLCARAPPSIVWIQWEKQRDTFQLTFFCWSKAAIFLNEFQTRAIYACLLVCRDICDKQDRSSSEKIIVVKCLSHNSDAEQQQEKELNRNVIVEVYRQLN